MAWNYCNACKHFAIIKFCHVCVCVDKEHNFYISLVRFKRREFEISVKIVYVCHIKSVTNELVTLNGRTGERSNRGRRATDDGNM